jgi:hypothetical protein
LAAGSSRPHTPDPHQPTLSERNPGIDGLSSSSSAGLTASEDESNSRIPETALNALWPGL